MASTANSQTTSLPDTTATDTSLAAFGLYPVTFNGQAGVFMTELSARKVVYDYALLRRYKAEKITLTKRVSTLERLKDNQEAESRSLKADLADANKAFEFSQSNATTLSMQLEAEQTSNRNTVIKAVVITVVAAILTGATGYAVGRFAK